MSTEDGDVTLRPARPGDSVAVAEIWYHRNGWTDEGLFEHHAPSAGGAVPVPAHRYVKHVGGGLRRPEIHIG